MPHITLSTDGRGPVKWNERRRKQVTSPVPRDQNCRGPKQKRRRRALGPLSEIFFFHQLFLPEQPESTSCEIIWRSLGPPTSLKPQEVCVWGTGDSLGPSRDKPTPSRGGVLLPPKALSTKAHSHAPPPGSAPRRRRRRGGGFPLPVANC